MAEFAKLVDSLGPAAAGVVDSLFYDSKARRCEISLHGTAGEATVELIRQAAYETLSQFFLLDEYYVGLPLERAESALAEAEDPDDAEHVRHLVASAEAEALADAAILTDSAIEAETDMGEKEQPAPPPLLPPPRKGFKRLVSATTGPRPADPGAASSKGKQGESILNAWFQKQGLSYIAVCQAPETFAPIFKAGIKRPDFLMLIEGVGLLAIDAKNKAFSGGFTLELEAELKNAIAFERLFRMPLWYAFCDCAAGMKEWHWISALKAVEVGIERSTAAGKKFLFIELNHFEEITVADDLAKLYTQRLSSFTKIRGL